MAERLQNEIEAGELVQDGVERMRERPKDSEEQKLYYSGKKNAHREEFANWKSGNKVDRVFIANR